MIRMIRVSCARRPRSPERPDAWDADPVSDDKAITLGVTGRGVVGKAGFEPAISRSRTGRDTKLRYFPNQEAATNAAAERIWPPHVVRSPAFSLLLGRTHLAIEPEPVVHAEHAERRARHGFSLPALHF